MANIFQTGNHALNQSANLAVGKSTAGLPKREQPTNLPGTIKLNGPAPAAPQGSNPFLPGGALMGPAMQQIQDQIKAQQASIIASRQQPAIQAPQRKNPFAELRSRALDLNNPYKDGKWRDLYINQQRGGLQTEHSFANQNIASALADRGLSQAGISGLEVGMIRENEIDRSNALGQLTADAIADATYRDSEFERQRAGAIDAISVAQAQGDLAFGEAAFNEFLKMKLLPGELESQRLTTVGQNLNNMLTQQNMAHDAQLQPGRLTQQGLTTDGMALNNQRTKQLMDQAAQLFPEQLKQQQVASTLAKLDLQQKQDMIKWWNENSWWAGPAEFLGKLAVVAGPVAATVLTGGAAAPLVPAGVAMASGISFAPPTQTGGSVQYRPDATTYNVLPPLGVPHTPRLPNTGNRGVYYPGFD